jgi:hypothetical protein
VELAREPHRSHARDLRLVRRNPRVFNHTDVLVPADWLKAEQTAAAVKVSEIVYFTAGLSPDTALWEAQCSVTRAERARCHSRGRRQVRLFRQHLHVPAEWPRADGREAV